MSNDLKLLGQILISKKAEIAHEVHKDRLAGIPMTESQKRDFKSEEQNLLDIRANFISLFGQALIDHQDKQKVINSIIKWGEETGAYIFNLGAPLDEALKDTSYYREYLWKAIRNASTSHKISVDTLFDAIFVIDPLLDKAIYYFSLTYVNYYQQSLNNAKNAFLELSVPVIPLIKGVGVLPIIGNIDTERAKLLMEKTLSQATELKLNHLIVDLSGVLIVDTMVADQLFKIVGALTLIGVKTILTGIRPEVAQTVVSLGIRLEELIVKSNLHQAFEELQ
ncbi:STAS domain-containing protein [Mesobacillus foraminis]|uniref:STAS domain-containing protein n=1 Tax=Mesobacillus foraminis TaxID=279826 RepID=UPI000EF554AC|nr:STAS domain-containing protein [Mesobacillus foraminis]